MGIANQHIAVTDGIGEFGGTHAIGVLAWYPDIQNVLVLGFGDAQRSLHHERWKRRADEQVQGCEGLVLQVHRPCLGVNSGSRRKGRELSPIGVRDDVGFGAVSPLNLQYTV